MIDVITRRKRLLGKIANKSILVLYSGKAKIQSGDNDYPYFADRNFYYFTFIDQENSYLILIKDKGIKEILYMDEYSEYYEKWYGKKMPFNTASKISKIKDIRSSNKFYDDLDKLFKKYKRVYTDSIPGDNFLYNLLIQYRKTNDFYSMNDIAKELRMIKDEDEIKNIVEAIKVTHLGLKRIIKEIKNCKYEYEVYNWFNHEILNHGTHEIGFPSIIASGVNATCLHYPTPYDKLGPKGLVLCDVGAGYNHYSSDITRTLPINGKYDEYQKMVYQIVLNTNKKVIEFIKPGRTIEELQKFAKDYLTAQCLDKGIIKKASDIDKVYYHNISHHLGLDTHDFSNRSKPLEKGNVITVEPGLYIKEKKIGIRIEDDVLVTENGSKCLSSFIEKEIKDIEKLF